MKLISICITTLMLRLMGHASAFPNPSCTGTSRFCQGGQFYLDYDYMFMEGNVPLGMLAVFFMEKTTFSTTSPSTYTQPTNQVKYHQNGATTTNVRRIRRIWGLPNPGSSYTLPTTVPNNPYQFLYTSPDSQVVANSGWFAGDVIPFTSCAYIFSIATSVSGATMTINYNVEQW